MKFETVIGLEVHLQLSTKTKAFCGCSTRFGSPPNSQTCPVCLGFPGSLPVLNEEAFLRSIKVALALNCAIEASVKFDRKNYYYPDLPKNYQISQYDRPIAFNGYVDITAPGGKKRIRVKRVHLEEDAGKLIHPQGEGYSLVDYNRAGIPLLEIVTEPDMNSPQEAYDYLSRLKSTLEYLRVSDCDMEKGSLRCDANISVRPEGSSKLGTKVELKNMNSFRYVRLALEYEEGRQASIAGEGGRIAQETRLWDSGKNMTNSMRTKEEAHDYRYFPDPDLVPFEIGEELAGRVKMTLPELPEARSARFAAEFGLSEYDAGVLTGSIDLAEYFEEGAEIYPDKKNLANWIINDMSAQAGVHGVPVNQLGLKPDELVDLLKAVDSKVISRKMAKEILTEAIETKKTPLSIVQAKGLSQITDNAQIERIVDIILQREGKSVDDYKNGKKNALTFLIGQIMKETKGKASPAVVNEILKKRLGD